MLIKRNETNNIVECLFDSSNVIASKYDKTTQELIVTYKAGTQYKYKGVKSTDYSRFELADSQGKEINSRIRLYPNEKLGNVDLAKLINEIQENKPKELSQEEKQLIVAMEAFLIYHKNKYSIDMNELENVEDYIKKFKEAKNNPITE